MGKVRYRRRPRLRANVDNRNRTFTRSLEPQHHKPHTGYNPKMGIIMMIRLLTLERRKVMFHSLRERVLYGRVNCNTSAKTLVICLGEENGQLFMMR